MGTVALGLKTASELGKIYEYDDALGLALFTGKTERLHQKNLELEFDAQVFHQGFDAEINRIKKMSLQEAAENILEIGMTITLGMVVQQAVIKFASAAGRALITKIADLVASNNPFTQEYLVEVAELGKITLGTEFETTTEFATLAEKSNEKFASFKASSQESISQAIKKSSGRAAQESGKEYENFLVQKLGGKGSFKVLNREFDGAVGNVWYEAKSGEYWNKITSNEERLRHFKERMGTGLKIAYDNGAKYELYSNVPIPQTIKEWLTKKGIPFFEIPFTKN